MKLGEILTVLDVRAKFVVNEEHSDNVLFDSNKSSRNLPDEYKKLRSLEDRAVTCISYNAENDDEFVICVKIIVPNESEPLAV